MPDIVLATLNAKYIHAAFGLRYLLANLGALRSQAGLLEFDINQKPVDIVEVLLASQPKIVGLGVYIWNAVPTAEVIGMLKRLRPELTIVVGGPEVSYETETHPVAALADYVIPGEADLKFGEVCGGLLNGGKPSSKILPAAPPEFSALTLPYDLYSDHDLAHRVVYVEASRGCPFSCEFCLSSIDSRVRQVPLPRLFEEFERLLGRGLKRFKFVDRTFNLDWRRSRAILEFFLERYQPGQFLHFEMVPDRLPESLREVLVEFPPGTLQFEVGIQTLNQEVGRRVQRRQDCGQLTQNLSFLRQRTAVHVHADLIAGLPGETIESFASGFDRLVELGPQEIQVGILKRLRGAPVSRHDAEWEMVYGGSPPYELLRNNLIDFASMQRLRRFARYWDLVGNSGNFVECTRLIWSEGKSSSERREDPEGAAARPRQGATTPFHGFMRWADWLFARIKRTDGIALMRLMELLFRFLCDEVRLDPRQVAAAMWRDYQRGGHRDKPGFLREFLGAEEPMSTQGDSQRASPRRQARHLG